MSNYNRFEAKMNAVKKDKSKPYKIPVMSAKRKKESKVLAVIKAGMMIKLDGLCQLKGPNCLTFATDYEHIQKSSPANYIDPNNGTLACRICNSEKESKPELFKEHSISRFKK